MQTFQHNQQRHGRLNTLNSSNKKQRFPRHLYHSLLYGEGGKYFNIRQLLKYKLYSMFSVQFECMHSKVSTPMSMEETFLSLWLPEWTINSHFIREPQRNSYQNTSIRMSKILNSDNKMQVRSWRNRNSHSLLVGMQNSMSTLEDNFNRFLVCVCMFYFNKTKPPLTIWSSNHTPHYLPKSIKNLCPHKNLHTNTYNSIIDNCQTRCPSFGDWINCGKCG